MGVVEALERAGFERSKGRRSPPPSNSRAATDLRELHAVITRIDTRRPRAGEEETIKWLLGTVLDSVVASAVAVIGVMMRLWQ